MKKKRSKSASRKNDQQKTQSTEQTSKEEAEDGRSFAGKRRPAIEDGKRFSIWTRNLRYRRRRRKRLAFGPRGLEKSGGGMAKRW